LPAPAGETVAYRWARSEDAAAVAGLHAESWRRHYRGSYPDAFLDGPVFENRAAVWDERLAALVGDGDPDAGTVTILAESGSGDLVGFVHVVLDDDPAWGALVDNLHVRADLKGGGIGTSLLARAAGAVVARRPSSGLFLWVLEANVEAQAFYLARGGGFQGTRIATAPGGGEPLVAIRCVWPDPHVLLEAPTPT